MRSRHTAKKSSPCLLQLEKSWHRKKVPARPKINKHKVHLRFGVGSKRSLEALGSSRRHHQDIWFRPFIFEGKLKPREGPFLAPFSQVSHSAPRPPCLQPCRVPLPRWAVTAPDTVRTSAPLQWATGVPTPSWFQPTSCAHTWPLGSSVSPWPRSQSTSCAVCSQAAPCYCVTEKTGGPVEFEQVREAMRNCGV